MIVLGEFGEILTKDPSWVLIVYNTEHLKLTPRTIWQKAAEEDDAGDYTLLVYLYSAMLAGKLPKKWIKILAWLLKYRVKLDRNLPEFELSPEERDLMERIKKELSHIKRRTERPVVVEYDLWEKMVKNKVPLKRLLERSI